VTITRYHRGCCGRHAPLFALPSFRPTEQILAADDCDKDITLDIIPTKRGRCKGNVASRKYQLDALPSWIEF
jgi:hypothetical protein